MILDLSFSFLVHVTSCSSRFLRCHHLSILVFILRLNISQPNLILILLSIDFLKLLPPFSELVFPGFPRLFLLSSLPAHEKFLIFIIILSEPPPYSQQVLLLPIPPDFLLRGARRARWRGRTEAVRARWRCARGIGVTPGTFALLLFWAFFGGLWLFSLGGFLIFLFGCIWRGAGRGAWRRGRRLGFLGFLFFLIFGLRFIGLAGIRIWWFSARFGFLLFFATLILGLFWFFAFFSRSFLFVSLRWARAWRWWWRVFIGHFAAHHWRFFLLIRFSEFWAFIVSRIFRIWLIVSLWILLIFFLFGALRLFLFLWFLWRLFGRSRSWETLLRFRWKLYLSLFIELLQLDLILLKPLILNLKLLLPLPLLFLFPLTFLHLTSLLRDLPSEVIILPLLLRILLATALPFFQLNTPFFG